MKQLAQEFIQKVRTPIDYEAVEVPEVELTDYEKQLLKEIDAKKNNPPNPYMKKPRKLTQEELDVKNKE